VRFGYLVSAAAIQLLVFFLPIAAGIAGLMSGGIAGLAAVTGWFVVGIPLSYALMDARAARLARAADRSHLSAVRTSAPLAHPADLH
jgi:hypothetical protein